MERDARRGFNAGAVVVAGMLVAATVSQSAADWSFAVVCDSRSSYLSDPGGISNPYYSADGISPYFKNVALALSRETGLDFVLNPGDLVRGKSPYNTADYMASGIQQWNIYMAPVAEKMPIYNVRGNHDAYGVTNSANVLVDSTGVWKANTTIPDGNPLTQDSGSQAGLSYSFTHKGSLFVGLDQYVGTGPAVTKALVNYDQTFLRAQLATPAAHKFVFGHQPVWNYKADELIGNSSGTASGATAKALADDMQVGHVDLYFSGHVHSYGRFSKTGYNFQEMIVGTGGAPQDDPTLIDGGPGGTTYTRDPNLVVLATAGGAGSNARFGYAVVTVHDDGDVTTIVKFLSDPNDPNSPVVAFDDITPPTLAPVADRTVLWPANHKMVLVTIDAHAQDDSGETPSLGATVASNEPQNGLGDGDTPADWTDPVVDQTSGKISVYLRAERAGRGNGREYTVTITATDAAGNSSSTPVTISVPRSQGK